MKDYDAQLKVQAYLDGELSGSETRQVEQWLAEDPQARQLHAELKTTRGTLHTNEPEVKLPVPHAFNWSQIQKRIAAEQAAEVSGAATGFDWLGALRRYLAPITTLAVALILAIGIGALLTANPASDYVEIENYSADLNISSFHATSEKMFVVWVSAKESTADQAVDDWEEMYQ
jgi:anti-sigma factor RsiW